MSRKETEELVCCRDQVPYQKVYTALSVIELEFDWTLTNFAYQAVLKVCAKDMSEPAARMALRILDGLRVRCYPLLLACMSRQQVAAQNGYRAAGAMLSSAARMHVTATGCSAEWIPAARPSHKVGAIRVVTRCQSAQRLLQEQQAQIGCMVQSTAHGQGVAPSHRCADAHLTCTEVQCSNSSCFTYNPWTSTSCSSLERRKGGLDSLSMSST